MEYENLFFGNQLGHIQHMFASCLFTFTLLYIALLAMATQYMCIELCNLAQLQLPGSVSVFLSLYFQVSTYSPPGWPLSTSRRQPTVSLVPTTPTP